ncbi:MAG: hypothetical protein HRU75_05700 [Planctomycetia bacterium]|nr:MAG: hypothetical protein HRU75_05700 [Planctomycetia bacterium]
MRLYIRIALISAVLGIAMPSLSYAKSEGDFDADDFAGLECEGDIVPANPHVKSCSAHYIPPQGNGPVKTTPSCVISAVCGLGTFHPYFITPFSGTAADCLRACNRDPRCTGKCNLSVGGKADGKKNGVPKKKKGPKKPKKGKKNA